MSVLREIDQLVVFVNDDDDDKCEIIQSRKILYNTSYLYKHLSWNITTTFYYIFFNVIASNNL